MKSRLFTYDRCACGWEYLAGLGGVCRACGAAVQSKRPASEPMLLGDILGAALRGEITPQEAQALATAKTPSTPTSGAA